MRNACHYLGTTYFVTAALGKYTKRRGINRVGVFMRLFIPIEAPGIRRFVLALYACIWAGWV